MWLLLTGETRHLGIAATRVATAAGHDVVLGQSGRHEPQPGVARLVAT